MLTYLRRFRLVLLLSLSEELELDVLALLLLEDESLPKFYLFLSSIEYEFLCRHVSWSGISIHVRGHHFGIAHCDHRGTGTVVVIIMPVVVLNTPITMRIILVRIVMVIILSTAIIVVILVV